MNVLEFLRRIIPGSDRRRVAAALRAVRADDVAGLQLILEADPGIVHVRAKGNTVLEWLTQPDFSPPDPRVVGALIDAGAEPDRALNLAGCWNLPDMCDQLLAAGADPAARADAAITPLESAAMHSSREAADVLIARGLHRPSLWLAAATGQLELVRDWIGPHMELRRDPGPYRPDWADVGRPPGEAPSADAEEIVGEAFVFAALNDRRDVVEFLLSLGVDADSRPYLNTTALHFAIQFHRLEMARLLLDRGASVSIRDDVFGADAHGWAIACHNGSNLSEAIVELVAAATAG